MQDSIRRPGARKPAIHISEADYDLIASFAMSLEGRSPALAQMIFDEIDRANVHAREELPKDVVTLGSEVTYLDDTTGALRSIRLVLPAEADIEAGRVSIATQMGAGLIGLKAGHSMNWPCPDGRPRTLKILEVKQAS